MKMEKKLSKLKMPMKKDPEEEMDLGELDLDEDMEVGEEEPLADEMEMMEGEEDVEQSPAAALSDDELLAELKKRGLEKSMAEGEEEEEEEEEAEEEEMV